MRESPDDKEERFWKVDASIFHTHRINSTLHRALSLLRSLGKAFLYMLMFSYPILLVYIGIDYGGLVFWSSLLASILILGLALSMSGYARNFAGTSGSLVKGLAALAIGLVAMISFFLGLFQFGALTILIMLAILATALSVVVLRARF